MTRILVRAALLAAIYLLVADESGSRRRARRGDAGARDRTGASRPRREPSSAPLSERLVAASVVGLQTAVEMVRGSWRVARFCLGDRDAPGFVEIPRDARSRHETALWGVLTGEAPDEVVVDATERHPHRPSRRRRRSGRRAGPARRRARAVAAEGGALAGARGGRSRRARLGDAAAAGRRCRAPALSRHAPPRSCAGRSRLDRRRAADDPLLPARRLVLHRRALSRSALLSFVSTLVAAGTCSAGGRRDGHGARRARGMPPRARARCSPRSASTASCGCRTSSTSSTRPASITGPAVIVDPARRARHAERGDHHERRAGLRVRADHLAALGARHREGGLASSRAGRGRSAGSGDARRG